MADEKMKITAKNRVRPSDLSLYDDPKDLFKIEYHAPEKSPLEESVSVVRKEVTEAIGATKEIREQVQQVYETGKAHTAGQVNYLLDEENVYARSSAIAVGGLVGLIFGMRGKSGIFKKLLYTSAGAGATTAALHPQITREVGQSVYKDANTYANVAYNFVVGVKPQEVEKPLMSTPVVKSKAETVVREVSSPYPSMLSLAYSKHYSAKIKPKDTTLESQPHHLQGFGTVCDTCKKPQKKTSQSSDFAKNVEKIAEEVVETAESVKTGLVEVEKVSEGIQKTAETGVELVESGEKIAEVIPVIGSSAEIVLDATVDKLELVKESAAVVDTIAKKTEALVDVVEEGASEVAENFKSETEGKEVSSSDPPLIEKTASEPKKEPGLFVKMANFLVGTSNSINNNNLKSNVEDKELVKKDADNELIPKSNSPIIESPVTGVKEVEEVPVTDVKEVEEVSVTDKVDDVLLADTEKVLVSEKVEEVPVVDKVEEVPVVDKVEEVPVADKVEEVPVADKVEEVPVADKVEEVPVADKVEEVPVADKVEEVPVADKVEEVPVADTVEEVPVADTVEEVPVADKVEEVPATGKVEIAVSDKEKELVVSTNKVVDTSASSPTIDDVSSVKTEEPKSRSVFEKISTFFGGGEKLKDEKKLEGQEDKSTDNIQTTKPVNETNDSLGSLFSETEEFIPVVDEETVKSPISDEKVVVESDGAKMKDNVASLSSLPLDENSNVIQSVTENVSTANLSTSDFAKNVEKIAEEVVETAESVKTGLVEVEKVSEDIEMTAEIGVELVESGEKIAEVIPVIGSSAEVVLDATVDKLELVKESAAVVDTVAEKTEALIDAVEEGASEVAEHFKSEDTNQQNPETNLKENKGIFKKIASFFSSSDGNNNSVEEEKLGEDTPKEELALEMSTDNPDEEASAPEQQEIAVANTPDQEAAAPDTPVEVAVADTPVEAAVTDTLLEVAVADTPVEVAVADTPVEVAVADTLLEVAVADTLAVVAVADTPAVVAVADTPAELVVADTPVEVAVADTPVEVAVADTPVEVAVADATVEVAVADATVEVAVADATVEVAVADATVEVAVADATVEVAVADATVEVAVADATVEVAVADTPVEDAVADTPVEAAVTDTSVEVDISNKGTAALDSLNKDTSVAAEVLTEESMSDLNSTNQSSKVSDDSKKSKGSSISERLSNFFRPEKKDDSEKMEPNSENKPDVIVTNSNETKASFEDKKSSESLFSETEEFIPVEKKENTESKSNESISEKPETTQPSNVEILKNDDENLVISSKPTEGALKLTNVVNQNAPLLKKNSDGYTIIETSGSRESVTTASSNDTDVKVSTDASDQSNPKDSDMYTTRT